MVNPFDMNESSPPADCINSWSIKLLQNGTYVLTFRTNVKWIPYHRRNDNLFEFGFDGEDEQYQYIPDFLPKGHYLISDHHDKDTIVFIFTPVNHYQGGKIVKAWNRNGS